MKLGKKLLGIILGLSAMLTLGVSAVSAEVVKDPLGLTYGESTGLANQDIRLTVARIISVTLGLLGTIVVVIIIYAGFQWMTAGGNEDQVSEAKKRITAAVIGLAIILSAYAITQFVVTNLYSAANSVEYIKG